MIEAVVMAAGEGRRLRPLTERWPKALLPVDGRAVLATLLRELAAAGCPRATIVTGRLAEQIESLAGDGRAFGLEIAYARQPSPEGSADAVRKAVDAGVRAPFLVTVGDTVFRPKDLEAFASAAIEAGTPGAMAVRRHPPPGPGVAAVRVEGGRVTRVPDNDLSNPLAAASLWYLGAPLEPYLARTHGPPHELADAYQQAIDDGFEVSAIEVGSTRDLTDPLDLVEENFPYLQSP